MFRMKAGFGNDYCDGILSSDDSSCTVVIQYKDGNSVDVESVGVEVEELIRYLVKVASEPRVNVTEHSFETYLGRMTAEMLNAPLEEHKFTTGLKDDDCVVSVTEEDGLTYIISFDRSELTYTYTVADMESREVVTLTFTHALPLRFNKFIKTLNIEEE